MPLIEREGSDGTVVHELAQEAGGVAVIGRGANQALRIETLVLGVEDSHGRVLAPRSPSGVDADLRAGAYEAGQWRLAWELGQLGHSVDRSNREGELFEVHVPAREEREDSFSRHRQLMQTPLPEVELQPPTVEASVELDGQIDLLQTQVWTAEQGALMLEARAAEPDASEGLALAVAARRRHLDKLSTSLNALIEQRADTFGEPLQTTDEVIPELDRDEVSVPDPFDHVDVVGERRRALYTARMEYLTAWIADKPASWIEAQRQALGSPGHHLDRQAARLTRLIESRIEKAVQDLQGARTTDSPLDARGLERKLADLREQVSHLREEGLHLDDVTNADDLVAAAAYQREGLIREALREALAAEQQAELDRPEPEVQQAPEPQAPGLEL